VLDYTAFRFSLAHLPSAARSSMRDRRAANAARSARELCHVILHQHDLKHNTAEVGDERHRLLCIFA
jgi:hypothetical protein